MARLLPPAFGVALLAYVLVYLMWLVAPFGTEAQQAFIADFAIIPVDLLTIALWVAVAWRARSSNARRAWALLTLAWAGMLLGDTAYAWLNVVVGDLPFPSVADLGYLSFYGLMIIGLMSFPSAKRTRGESARFWLDVAMIVTAGGLFVWQLVLHSALEPSDINLVETALTVGYPVGDLVLLLGIAVTVLSPHQAANRRALAVIAVGSTLFFVGDLGFAVAEAEGSYVSGTWPDAIYMLATICFLAAGWVGCRDAGLADAPARQIHIGGVSPFPYGAVALGYALIVGVTWQSGGSVDLVLGGAALTALVVARQIVAVRDNVRLTRAQAAREGEERFRGLIQHASDVITIIDADAIVRYQTPSVTSVLGTDPAALIGRPFTDIVHAGDVAAVRALMSPSATPEVSSKVELRLRDLSGSWRTTETIAADLRDVPAVAGIVLTTRDVTDRKELEARLVDQAFHDPLTGLANRRLFYDRVEHALRRSTRRQAETVVAFIDIDAFKRINDTRGHEAGDQLLAAVAARISGALRTEDTAARLGGDEFAVLFEEVPDLRAIERRALELCRLIAEPYGIENATITVTASIGLAVAKSGAGSVVGLMREADLAMYAAKEAGRNRITVFDPTMQAKLVERVELEANLRAAVGGHGITPHFQPVFDVASGAIVGAEALARWADPSRRSIPPTVFIPVAEDTGLIVEIGRQIMSDACHEARRWVPGAGGRPLSVNVNVSVVQLEDQGFVDDVRRILEASGLSPNLLTIEITESILAADPSRAKARLEALKALGVKLSIDDFGTGYSSLSYLHTFPVDEIKIDRSFITQLRGEGDGQVFVRAIIDLARSLGLKTVAEGIETPGQLEILRKLGCTFGQGYLVGRPLAPDAFIGMLASTRPDGDRGAAPHPSPAAVVGEAG